MGVIDCSRKARKQWIIILAYHSRTNEIKKKYICTDYVYLYVYINKYLFTRKASRRQCIKILTYCRHQLF